MSGISATSALITPTAGSSTVDAIEALEWTDARASRRAAQAARARQVSGRRRNVDPTTCERDYTRDELEFLNAMQQYKQKSGRMFPTWSEVLEVIKSLGYEKAVQA